MAMSKTKNFQPWPFPQRSGAGRDERKKKGIWGRVKEGVYNNTEDEERESRIISRTPMVPKKSSRGLEEKKRQRGVEK